MEEAAGLPPDDFNKVPVMQHNPQNESVQALLIDDSPSAQVVALHGPLDRPIALTRFPDQGARSKGEHRLSLRTLAERIAAKTAPAKDRLPWLKLARFGDAKSTNGCLRHNANVLAVSGVEADYDAGQLSLDDAARLLEAAGIAALVYTSASHTPEAPRWRVLAPLSREREPGEREALCARLNGALGGVLDGASFTLSQSFYFGSVEGRHPVETRLVDGNYLDLVEGVEPLGKGGAPWEARPAAEPHNLDDLLADPPPPVDWDAVDAALERIPADCGYDDWIRVGMGLHHADAGGEDGFAAWADWSRTAENPASDRELESKWRGFGRGKGGVGLGTLFHLAGAHQGVGVDNDDFDDLDDDELLLIDDLPSAKPKWGRDPDARPHYKEPMAAHLAWLNRRHAVVPIGGKITVIREDDIRGLEVSRDHEWRKFYANYKAELRTRDDVKMIPVFPVWFEWEKRRTYDGMTFNPSGKVAPGLYNTWHGWSVAPDAGGSCDLFLAHLRDVICSGQESEYQWLIRWMAHLVQKPAEKPGTALILRGRKGAGKDTVGDYLGALFKRNHVKISQPDHLTGHFNAHLAEALLLHVEEGFWSGDKKAEGILKSLITAPVQAIERKGFDVQQMESFSRLLISSNEDWVVPATSDERRYFVLDVSEARLGDKPYFDALYAEMDNGGPAALLHYLQGVDLTGFNVRLPPVTQGLARQKVETLRNIELWWYQTLCDGHLTACDMDAESTWRENSIEIGRDHLRSLYACWMQGRPYQGTLIEDPGEFGRRFLKMFKPGSVGSARKRGENGARDYKYVLPPRSKSRSEFSWTALGVETWDWGDE